MTVVEGRLWMEHLGPNECWKLLAEHGVGRIGVLVDGVPEIYPINYGVLDQQIAFRTNTGNKLRGLGSSASVCFEIDELDPEHRTGWSVLAVGPAHELVKADDVRQVEDLGLDVWTLGDKPHWLAIRPTRVSGRRIGRSSPAPDA